MASVRQIMLDARPWRTENDFIEAIISALGGPTWHGRNYNALYDSMVVGSINEIEPPYEIVIKGVRAANAEVADAIRCFLLRVEEWRTRDTVKIAAKVEP
jgi:RNAse (barnase) inhibitor barstar